MGGLGLARGGALFSPDGTKFSFQVDRSVLTLSLCASFQGKNRRCDLAAKSTGSFAAWSWETHTQKEEPFVQCVSCSRCTLKTVSFCVLVCGVELGLFTLE
ncbi:Hypothetical predicted protein [Podarcis lilfordi]|uniref:Uncharacterized protein n=1 Tax=Podarcis lilfordi TaxID=74358 RepID=A0AA35P9Z9_9SAUR|nr:Hypothetical predicted protein [Podarcis lilfordi]